MASVVRWSLAVAGGALIVFGLLWTFVPDFACFGAESVGLLGTPVVPVEDANEPVLAVVWIGIVLLTQWLFLRPRGSWRLREGDGGRPKRAAAWGAGFCGMLLTVGLGAALMEIPDGWDEVAYTAESVHPGVYIAMVVTWALWAWIFAAYARRRGRILRGLIRGTIVELLVAAPVHAAYADRDDCYCTRGSYTALVFGFTALVWVFGPGVYFLYRSERTLRTPRTR